MVKIILDSQDKALRLVSLLREFPENVDVMKGRIMVDGKSILGVISLCHPKEKVEVSIHTSNQQIQKQFEDTLRVLR